MFVHFILKIASIVLFVIYQSLRGEQLAVQLVVRIFFTWYLKYQEMNDRATETRQWL